MNIGVLSDNRGTEKRVCLTPVSVKSLVSRGHRVLLESGAGIPAMFQDEEYQSAGADVRYDREEIFGRCDLLTKVTPLTAGDIPLLKPAQIVLSFHHLAASTREHLDAVLEREATLIGFEVIEDSTGDLPVLHAMSEIAGQLAVHASAHHLESRAGGRGILLGGATGIPPAHVVILGAGTVGLWAGRTALGNGAQVTLLDSSLPALRHAAAMLGPAVVTEIAHAHRIERAAGYADVLIGAVLNPGEKSPHVLTRDMVRQMKPGAVIVDVSIDQGGCVETSHPTTLEDPVFVEEGVMHYAVPNMTAAVARTASFALSNASLPRIEALADLGIETALREQKGLAAGVYTYRGELVAECVAHTFGIGSETLSDLVGTPDYPGNIFA